MCVIVYLKLNDSTLLIKNRDRNYIPRIQIICEIINGVEVAYIYDLDTEWVEGLNENGFGIVNSSLQVDYDENPLESNLLDKKEKIRSKNKYLNALATLSTNYFQDRLFEPSYYEDISLQGHTIMANPYYALHIESKTGLKPHIKLLDNYIVRTNHGVNIKNTGYVQGKPYISSIHRQKLIESEIEKNNPTTYLDVFDIMNRNYPKLDIDYHPYRNNSKYFFTTSQMILDLTNRVLYFNYDSNFCKFMGIINKIPHTQPKIKIIIGQTTKKI